MAPPRDLSPLSVLGFSVRQGRLYRMLLRRSRTAFPDLVGQSGMDEEELREHLRQFVGAGLVTLLDDVVQVNPPEQALGRMLSDETRRLTSRGEQLEAVRGLLPSLVADHVSSRAPTGEPVTVELLHGGDIAQLVRSLSAASTGDLLWLRPDPWNVGPGREIDAWVQDLVRSGRRSRAIYGLDVLHHAPEVIHNRAGAGEEVRIMAEVPTRLAVLGTSAALVAEHFEVFDGGRLVLRHHGLVAAMTLMFEGLWEKAMAVPGLEGRRDGAVDQRLLLAQLAAGAKDEQIARVLDVSVRTVRRRVADLLDELGAGSRFQAGVEAVRRGWA